MKRKLRRSNIPAFIIHSKSFDTKAIKEEVLEDGSIKMGLEGYASTTAKDGSGDVVLPDAFKLERYLLNPVLKVGHKRGEQYNIGRVEEIRPDTNGVYIKANAILNPEIESHKELIHGIRHKLINGFSIGFMTVKEYYDTEKQANIIEELELYEISLVDIPDNPLTVRKALKAYRDAKSSDDIRIGDEVIAGETKGIVVEVETIEGKDLDGKVVMKNDPVAFVETTDGKFAFNFSEMEKVKATNDGVGLAEPSEPQLDDVTESDTSSPKKDEEDKKENFGGKEKKLDQGESLQSMLEEAVIESMNLNMDTTWVWITAVFVNEVVFYVDSDDSDKGTHYRVGYTMSDGSLSFTEEPIEVESSTEWVDVVKSIKEMTDEEISEVYSKYSDTVNMSASELEEWSNTEGSKEASLSGAPIKRNLRLLRKNKSEWTGKDAADANKTIAFVARMKENLGGESIIVDENGKECGTKAYISLKNWAFDANKSNSKDLLDYDISKMNKKEVLEKIEELKSHAETMEDDVADTTEVETQDVVSEEVEEVTEETKDEVVSQDAQENGKVPADSEKAENAEEEKGEEGTDEKYVTQEEFRDFAQGVLTAMNELISSKKSHKTRVVKSPMNYVHVESKQDTKLVKEAKKASKASKGFF